MAQRLNKAQRRSADYWDLILRLSALETLAAKCRLWRTYHAINKARREAGYERAVQLDPKGRRGHDRARTLLEKGR